MKKSVILLFLIVNFGLSCAESNAPRYKVLYGMKGTSEEKYIGKTGRLVKISRPIDRVPGEPDLVYLKFGALDIEAFRWSQIESLDKNVTLSEYVVRD